MTRKTRRKLLRYTADGFLAGLACLNVERCAPAIADFDVDFGDAWRQWYPAQPPGLLPVIEPGGIGPRELLYCIRLSDSPYRYCDLKLERAPLGLTPWEFLETCAGGISPQEWVRLAGLYQKAVRARQKNGPDSIA